MNVRPTQLRLSPHFLLSDFMGNNSVYMRGVANDFVGDESHLNEARALCDSLLEPALRMLGSASVTYGYISPSASREIVTYQNPDKPSYHRWDDGAAADLVFHDVILRGGSPISAAFDLHERLSTYSRMITYSESAGICLASRLSEVAASKYRQAFYENRYIGIPQPKYSSVPTTNARYESYKQEAMADVERYGWQGKGYPSKHGGGIRQMHHIRLSKYCLVSDFLYAEDAVAYGVHNRPSAVKHPQQRVWFNAAAAMYDDLIDSMGILRASVVSAYRSHNVIENLGGDSWTDENVTIEVQLPEGEKTIPKRALSRLSKTKSEPRVDCDSQTGRVLLSVDPASVPLFNPNDYIGA